MGLRKVGRELQGAGKRSLFSDVGSIVACFIVLLSSDSGQSSTKHTALFHMADRSFVFDTTNLLNTDLMYYTEIIQNGGSLASQYEKHREKIELALEQMYNAILENQ